MNDEPIHLEGYDPAAMQATLRPHVKRLIDYTDRLIPSDLRRVIDAQDVVQDTFIDGARARATLPATSDPDSVWRWLVTIARHKLTDTIRHQRAAKRGGGRLRLDEAAAMHGSVIVLLEELAVHSRTPSRSAVRREFLAAVERAMQQINPNYRDAVRLRYLEGLSLCDAAARMSRTEDSTKKLCLRGLQALREQLRSASLYI